MAMAYSTRMRSRQMIWQYQIRKWEVAIKTMYIPWGSLALPKPQAFLGTNFCFFLPEKKAGALPCAGHEYSVISLWPPDTVNIMTFGWSHGSRIENPYLPFLLDKHTTKWDCFASQYRFPDISEMLLNISQLFYITRFSNENNRTLGLFANLSL